MSVAAKTREPAADAVDLYSARSSECCYRSWRSAKWNLEKAQSTRHRTDTSLPNARRNPPGASEAPRPASIQLPAADEPFTDRPIPKRSG